MAALGQAPVSLPWAALPAFGLAHWLFSSAESPRAAAWLGWMFGTAYFAAALFWIVEPFFVDPARHGWMAPFALIGMSAGLAVFWALAFGGARRLASHGGCRAALAWAAAMTAAELARSYLFTGFPWGLIGHVWIGWGPMHLAAWIGPVGLTFLTLLAAALSVAAWRKRRALAAFPLGAAALLYAAGQYQGGMPVPAADEPPMLRLVQPNAPQHLKWHPDYAPLFFDRMIEFTAAPARRRPDLIVWPETAIPAVLHRAGGELGLIAEAASGAPVALGIQRFDENRAFNSLILLDRSGAVAEVYDKHHLVPFGEYLPAYGFLSRLPFGTFVEERGYGYSPGPGARLIDLGITGKALPLICYEAVFPQDIHAAPERPRLLLQITNDAWFGKIAGPYQHLAQARLRAVEQGLPMVRVANTGISAVIDARGGISSALPLGEAGFIDSPLPPSLPPTIYSRTGDWPAFFVLLGLVAGLFAFRAKSAIDAGAGRE